MKVELPIIRPEEQTPLVEALVVIIQQLADRVGQQDVTIQQLRDEVAQLKGQKPRPTLRPSVLERAPAPPTPPEGGKRPGSAKRPKTAELTIHHEQPLHMDHPPQDATFRGYEPYVVQ